MKKAKDLMNRDLTSVAEDAPLKEAAKLLAQRNLSGVPVVNKKKQVAGFISERDIIAVIFPGNINLGDHDVISLQRLAPQLKHLQKGTGESVRDHMNKTLYSVGEETPAAEVAQLMLEKNIKRLPVIDQNEHLVGIIYRSTLLKLFQKELL